MTYPDNVPEYNRFRIPQPTSVDTSTRQVVVVLSPPQFWEYLAGQMSLLGEVNIWGKRGNLSPETLVDIYNNEVQFVYDLCAFVEACLEELGEGTEPGNPGRGWPSVDAPERGDVPGNSREPNDDDLDCIWFATGPAFQVFDDFVTSAISVLQTIVDTVAQYDDNVTLLFKVIPNIPVKAAEAMADAVAVISQTFVNDLEAARQQQAVEDTWRCAAFCRVRSRGQPYTLTRDDLVAAVGAWSAEVESLSSVPNPLIRLFATALRHAWNVNLMLSRWSIATDDGCNNNWETLCTNCNPDQFVVTFGGDGWQDWRDATSAEMSNAELTGGFNSAEGNPSPCSWVEGSVGDSEAMETGAFIDLQGDKTVIGVDADVFGNKFGGNDKVRYHVKLLDASQNVVNTKVTEEDDTGGTWETRTFNFNQSGVRYIVAYVLRIFAHASSGEYGIDNIKVSVSS